MNSHLNVRSALALAIALLTLAGCAGVAVVGAGAGALVLTDRRVSETYLADEGIEIRAANRISEKLGSKAHVNVTSYNRTLLLTGEVPDAAARELAEKIGTEVPNVRAISNELAIAGPSTLGGRSNDAYLTSKVKARFVDHGKFSPNHVKVVTEAGVVFLLGLVTQTEADAAVDIARTTGGVQKVVRVFEIISPEQASKIDNPNPAPAPVKSATPSEKK